MTTSFADIGRSRALGPALQGMRREREGLRREALTMRSQALQQNRWNKQEKRLNDATAENLRITERKEKLVMVDRIGGGFYGGPSGDPAKVALGVAESMGLVESDADGTKFIQTQHLPTIRKALPKEQMGLARITQAKKQLAGIQDKESEAYIKGDKERAQAILKQQLEIETFQTAHKGYQAALNARKLSPRDLAFQNLTPEEQKQTIMKPDTQINIGASVDKQTAVAAAKERALLKTAQFRATVQKDVRALNLDMWRRWTKPQKTDAVRTETDKRVRQTYPDARYGVINGRKGWYLKDEKGEFVLVSPWNE